jgi:hypothetical protein
LVFSCQVLVNSWTREAVDRGGEGNGNGENRESDEAVWRMVRLRRRGEVGRG